MASSGNNVAPAGPATAVTLAGAGKRYGRPGNEVVALAPLSLDIRHGEAIAIMGPSGAGKTTLLSLIAGEESPTTGSISLDGRELAGMRPGRELASLVGMVHQQFDLIPNLSALQNVLAGRLGERSFFRSLVSLAAPIERDLAMSALENVGVAGQARQRTSRLSGGEQQRVAIARLLVQDPAIVIADEPVASLDPSRAERVLEMLLDLARHDGKTLVASMHSVEMVRGRFDRFIGLRNGEMQFDLPAADVTDEALEQLYRLEGLRAEA